MQLKFIPVLFCAFFLLCQPIIAGESEYNFIRGLKQDIAKDLTQDYNKLDPQLIANFAQSPVFKNYKILFLTGFLSKEISRLYQYFDEQMAFFSSLGIENERLKLLSAQGIEQNAAIIIQHIKNETKPVIIFSHSKGGLDLLHALIISGLKKDTDWTKKIKGWIALQSPFYGSPVADDFDKIRLVSNGILSLLQGEYQALQDLMVKSRILYMNTYAQEVQFWTKQIPIITLATYIQMPRVKDAFTLFFLGGKNSILSGLRDYYYKKKILIDGLNPYQSAILPDTFYILLTEVDHLSTVSKNKYNQFNRIDFTKRVLILLLKKFPSLRAF